MMLFNNNNLFAPRQTGHLAYDKLEFWNMFHELNNRYDWFVDYDGFNQFIESKFNKDAHILLPGVGTSNMISDLKAVGFKHLTYSDFSSVLVERLKKQYPDTPCWTDDIRYTKITPNCYDLIIDKGLLDCYMRGKNSHQLDLTRAILSNYHKILTRFGQLVYIGSIGITEMNMLIDTKQWQITYMHPLHSHPLSHNKRKRCINHGIDINLFRLRKKC